MHEDHSVSSLQIGQHLVGIHLNVEAHKCFTPTSYNSGTKVFIRYSNINGKLRYEYSHEVPRPPKREPLPTCARTLGSILYVYSYARGFRAHWVSAYANYD